MCFNKEVSILTYLIGLLGVYQLYTLGYTIETIFYFWVIQMQLIDYFIWKNQPCNQTSEITNQNIKYTKLGILINHLEPFVLWFAIYLFSNRKLPDFVNYYMFAFAIYTYHYTKAVYKNECTTTSEKSSPHLYWKWNYGPNTAMYYISFLIALVLLGFYGMNYGNINAIVFATSFIISYFLYNRKKIVGRMWCYMAAFGPWILPYLYRIFG